jgi:ribosomal protein S18 acetylase RimI-like enzyme
MVQFKPVIHKADFKTIAELAKEIWTEHYTSIIGTDQVNYMLDKFQSETAIQHQIKIDKYNYHIISNKQKPVGYLAFKTEKNALFLSKIYISKGARGQGLGKLAMNFIEKQAKQSKCKKIYLTVNKQNINSIKAYQKIGFKTIEALVMDIGNGFVMDDYKMEKAIVFSSSKK